MSRKSDEGVVTLDLQEEISQRLGQSNATKLNGRTSNVIVEAVKMFTTKGKVSDISRKPFFAAVKSANVSIQPWPSATNLKTQLPAGSNWNLESTNASQDRLKVGRSFNIPNIEVRQSSIDDDYAGGEDDDEAMNEDEVVKPSSRRNSQ